VSARGAAPVDAETGPVEAAVLAELARDAPGGVRIETCVPSSGGALRLVRGGAAAAAGGETVVLLHGRGHAAPIWFPCWPALAARHPLLAIDLPGFGQSAPPALPGRLRRSDAEMALGAFVDPIEACLAAEVAAGRASGLALVGHSLGGLVALELALRARLPVRRLVLIDAMGLGPAVTRAGRVFFRLHPERLQRWLGPRLFGRLNPSPPTSLGRRVAALELELLSAPAAAPARAVAARAFDVLCPLFGPVFHRRGRLAEIAVPVFLLWGARDAALPAANAAAARAELRAATILILSQGHSPHLDAPEQALPPLLEFLAAGARHG
jgi:pimeloyl-ACP methyl ester carboxylesterase